MDYRIRNIIITFLPVVFLLLVIFIVKDWNKGQLIIHNSKGSMLIIQDETHMIDNDVFTLEFWPGKYQIALKKPSYYNWSDTIEIVRQSDTNVYPDFIYVPNTTDLETITPYVIPEDKKQKNINGDILYGDNQSEIFYQNTEQKKLLNILPNLLYMLFSPTRDKAIVITSDPEITTTAYYIYDLNTYSLSPIVKDKLISGASFSSDGKSIVYLEPISEKDSRIMLMNIKSKDKKEITRFYNLQNVKTRFVLGDSSIIVLPTIGKPDLFLVDIKTGRKQKLTQTEDVKDFKTSSNGEAVFFTKNENTDLVYFLNLKTRTFFKLPENIKDINKVDFLQNENKLIFSENKHNYSNPDLTQKSYDTISLFDISSFQITNIDTFEDTLIDKYLKLDEENHTLYFLDANAKYHSLTISD